MRLSSTSNRDNANFIIHLNSTHNDHGENIDGKGTITECDIRLKNSNNQFNPNQFYAVVDEEISQGLLHAENVGPNVVPSEGIGSCIAGYGEGWKKNIDSNIMNALYAMKNCTFDGHGFCSEK